MGVLGKHTVKTAFKYPIGTQFRPVGKDYVCTVFEHLTTRDSTGDIHKLRYWCTHVRNGQTLHDTDVVETTISRALAAHL